MENKPKFKLTKPWHYTVVFSVVLVLLLLLGIWGIANTPDPWLYGWFLFLGTPLITTSILSYLIKKHFLYLNFGNVFVQCFLCMFYISLGLLLSGSEGLICLLMASPIILLIALMGTGIGFTIADNPSTKSLKILFVLPFITLTENVDTTVPTRTVESEIVINAPPSKVWQHIHNFNIPESPTNIAFKAGIAYPIATQTFGDSLGATRHCKMSTGPIVERITQWQPNQTLGFDVVTMPETMKELSFYDIHPPHLHGTFVLQKGLFELEAIDGGKRTRLKGTSWYTLKMAPAFYWTAQSNYIIKQVHRRVFNHIKQQAEK